MSNPLHDLSRAAHEASTHSPHGHDLYTRPRSSGPPIELVVVIGMGLMIALFLFWAMFGSRDVEPAAADAPAAKAPAPQAPPPAVIQEWKQPPSPWAARSSAVVSEAAPGAVDAQRKQWTIPDAIQLSVKVEPDGSVFFVAVNRSPYTVIDLQAGALGDDHIVAMPAIPPGRTIRKQLDDSTLIKAAREGTLPTPAIYAGDFQP